MTKQIWNPKEGEIYRLRIRNNDYEILIRRVSEGVVYFTTLGRGQKSSVNINDFKRNSYFVETRLVRLRRACYKYGLTETDEIMRQTRL